MGRKPKSSVLSIFVGYALAPLLLGWVIKVRSLIYQQKIYLLKPKYEGVILSMTQLQSAEPLFLNMFWNFICKSSLLHQKQSCISLSFHLYYGLFCVLSWCFWAAKQWEQQHLHHLYFFCHWVELIYQTLPKVWSKSWDEIVTQRLIVRRREVGEVLV